MDPIREAIRFHLGRDIGDSPVTLYSLLDVPPDASERDIKTSFAIAAKRWNESDRQANPSLANEVGTLLKEAKRVLLNEEFRKSYDSTLKSPLRSGANVQATIPVSDSIETSETNWLPGGNPLSPFDESEFLQRSSSQLRTATPESGTQSDIEQRYTKLMTHVLAEPGTYSDETDELPTYELEGFDYRSEPGMQATSSRLVVVHENAFQSHGEDSEHNEHFSDTLVRTSPQVGSRRTVDPRQRAVTFGLFALGGTLIAGVGIYAFYRGGGQAKPDLASNTSVLPATAPPAPPAVTSGMDSDNSMDVPLPSPSMPDTAETVAEPAAPMVSEQSNAPNAGLSSTESQSIDAKEIERKLSELHSLLQRADFEAFKKLASSMPSATGDEGLDAKQARMLQMGELYQTAYSAFEQTKGNFKPGSALHVGNRELKVSDSTADALSVKSLSGVKSYAWKELPLGITLAILEEAMASTSPENAAAQAVFLKYQNHPDDLIQPRIAKLVEQSQGNGSIRSDFGLTFLDKYN